jgi:hypothetical protein
MANLKKTPLFYYGGWSDSIQARIKAALPAWVVLNTHAGPYAPSRPNAADIASLKASGIKVFSYIPTGGLRGYKYDSNSPDNSKVNVLAWIAAVHAEGCDGVFFDEGGVYSPVSGQTYQDSILDATLASPGGINGNAKYVYAWGNSWAGLTVLAYLNYAKSLGMLTCVGLDDYRESKLKANIFSYTDFVLTAEEYTTREVGQAPAGSEIMARSQCWVLAYDGSFNAAATNNALEYGFGGAYCCESLGSLSSNFEAYMAAVEYTVSPTPDPPIPDPPPGPGNGWNKYETYWAGGDWHYEVYGATWRAQTFKRPLTRTIKSLKISLQRVGAIGTATLSVKAVDGNNKPTGADLCSGTYDCSAISSAGFQTVEFTFGAGQELQANTRYAMVLRLPTGNPSNLLWWQADTDSSGGGYANGDAIGSTDSGSNWNINSGDEFYFEEWGTAAETPAVGNRAPFLTPIGPRSVQAARRLNIILTATDPDSDPLTYAAINLPSGATFDAAARRFTWLPNTRQAGVYYITFTVSDGSFTASENVMITVYRRARR